MADHQVNYQELLEAGNRFQEISNRMQQIDARVEAAIRLLQTKYFCGLVSAKAEQMRLEAIRPVIDRISERCMKLDSDLQAVVQRYQQADEDKGTLFED